MKKTFIIALAALALHTALPAYGTDVPKDDTTSGQSQKKQKKNVTYNEKGEIIKTGLNLGPLPVVAFDADRGFQFGALANIYNFGDGKNYPNPNSGSNSNSNWIQINGENVTLGVEKI